MLEYLFIAFIVIISIQFIYYFIFISSFLFPKKKLKKKNFELPVSVVICAKNEAKNLKEHLPLFSEQQYSNFELVLVNDGSYDETLQIMEEFQIEYPGKIKIVDVKPNEKFWGSKKYALTLGIKATSFEYLLFSDADCKPNSSEWISEMVQHFSENHQIVLGYGAFEKKTNSFLNKIIRFETLLTAIQYFSFANIGIPYMGVGRNIAYTKSAFFEVNGFAKHMNIKSGDDDLFINEVANKKNTTFCLSPKSFTISKPKENFKSWVSQKRRHISTANYYKFHHQFLLGLFYCSILLFWTFAIILTALNYKPLLIISLIVFRFVLFYCSNTIAAKNLKETDLLLFMPFYEIFLILTQMFIFIKNLSSKPSHW